MILFSNMHFIVMFVTAVCVLFLIKQRWPKRKNFYDSLALILVRVTKKLGFQSYSWAGFKISCKAFQAFVDLAITGLCDSLEATRLLGASSGWFPCDALIAAKKVQRPYGVRSYRL